MRYLRALWAIFRELSKGPEGLTAEELGHYAQRRVMLRALMTVLVAPMVIGGIWAWPHLKEARRQHAQPCDTLLDASAVTSWAGAPAHLGHPDVGMYGCAVDWLDTGGQPLLTVRIRRPGGRILDGLDDAFDAPTGHPSATRPWVERWDWDREEIVRILHTPGAGDVARATVEDASIVLIDHTEPPRDLGSLVVAALERSEAATAYVAWLK